MQHGQDGFTLIEVLTVSVIIGVLAAIAIPVFLWLTMRAQTGVGTSDVRNAAVLMESYFTDNGDYGSASELAAAGLAPKVSKGTIVVIVQHDASGFCLAALRNSAIPGTVAALQSAAVRWYDSSGGGVQPPDATGCPNTSSIAGDWQTDVIDGG
jgi:prepilin-type N-terminal cleavage/methylation domain-containing protein